MEGPDHASCARQVLQDDRRLAGDVPRQVRNHEPAVEVIGAAGFVHHGKAHRFCLEELFYRLSGRRLRRQQ
jgi:hypothetical protein